MYHVWQGKYHIVIHDLHKKYGPVVRIAPTIVDLDFPELVKILYNTKGTWKKVRKCISINNHSLRDKADRILSWK